MATRIKLSERDAPRSAADRRIRVIFNPNAGRSRPVGGPRQTAADLEAVLTTAGAIAEVVETHSEDDARAVAAEAVQKGDDAVIAAGGDGTIGLVARELIGSATAL
ncbi:MAG TPA: acylglycerol kinase family protein, partial [Candidatus Limnocylindrales bacterium]|nr:acylglycerol kinase family protein [Candidatus Limnocylindrales bacterium]